MPNAVATKSMEFAVMIVTLSKFLRQETQEYELVSQLLRSGTSIGANVHEAIYAQSRKEFISKMQIALKEASETSYWLKLMRHTEVLPEEQYLETSLKCEKLIRILVAIVKKSKE